MIENSHKYLFKWLDSIKENDDTLKQVFRTLNMNSFIHSHRNNVPPIFFIIYIEMCLRRWLFFNIERTTWTTRRRHSIGHEVIERKLIIIYELMWFIGQGFVEIPQEEVHQNLRIMKRVRSTLLSLNLTVSSVIPR